MNVNNIGRVLVSLIVVLGFMGVTWIFLTSKAMGVAPSETVTLLVGALASNFTSVVAYWIGSSSGSTAKDEQQQRVAEKLADKVPVVAAPSIVPAAAIVAAAQAAAPAAAEAAAPAAAAEAAPPAAEVAAPAAAEAAVDAALAERGIDPKKGG